MAYSVSGTTITLTRGDSFFAQLALTDSSGNPYVPQAGDHIRFAMKKGYGNDPPLILKEIPKNTMVLELLPEDTKNLEYGTYNYDIELTTAMGIVDTFITTAKLRLTEEVH